MLYCILWPTILLKGLYTVNKLNNFYITELIEINQGIKESETIKKVKEEYEDMLMSLEEGIAVFEDMKINFSNQQFQKIISSFEQDGQRSTNKSLLDLKMFKIYHKLDSIFNDSSTGESPNRFKKVNQNTGLYSLREILQVDKSKIENKIFVINYKPGFHQNDGLKFKHVQLQVRKIKSKQDSSQKLMLQVIDVSDKMLFDEIK